MILFLSDLFWPPDQIGQSNLQLCNGHITTDSISWLELIGKILEQCNFQTKLYRLNILVSKNSGLCLELVVFY